MSLEWIPRSLLCLIGRSLCSLMFPLTFCFRSGSDHTGPFAVLQRGHEGPCLKQIFVEWINEHEFKSLTNKVLQKNQQWVPCLPLWPAGRGVRTFPQCAERSSGIPQGPADTRGWLPLGSPVTSTLFQQKHPVPSPVGLAAPGSHWCQRLTRWHWQSTGFCTVIILGTKSYLGCASSPAPSPHPHPCYFSAQTFLKYLLTV